MTGNRVLKIGALAAATLPLLQGVALAQETGDLYDGEALLEALLQREELCSTGMEAGIAIPHPRRPLPYAIAQPILVIANTPQGIGFGAPDGKPVDTLFLMACRTVHEHLKLLARLATALRSEAFRQVLARRAGPAEIIAALRREETAP